MSDWMHDIIRGDSVYYERDRYGMHWTSFGEPHPNIDAYRRPLPEIFSALIDAGWAFDRVVEPQPLPEMKAASENIYAQLSRSPAFICVRARRAA